jgi:hypothetical protein
MGGLTPNKSSASLSSYCSSSPSFNNNSSSQQLFDSRGASDPKINMEEYAYNKIFVGGLHYDTRDGIYPPSLPLFPFHPHLFLFLRRVQVIL